MVHYDLSHLTQQPDQSVLGPVQDDEALVMYAMIKGMRSRRVLEIGGLGGYSATNFVRAIDHGDGTRGTVYTVDLNRVPQVAGNHVCIRKDAADVSAADVDNEPLDVVFFDCHEYDAQMAMFVRLCKERMITDDTVLLLHDTNLHPIRTVPWAREVEGGFVHQSVERDMVNQFKDSFGYDCVSIRTRKAVHNDFLPYRHGLTICQKFEWLC